MRLATSNRFFQVAIGFRLNDHLLTGAMLYCAEEGPEGPQANTFITLLFNSAVRINRAAQARACCCAKRMEATCSAACIPPRRASSTALVNGTSNASTISAGSA